MTTTLPLPGRRPVAASVLRVGRRPVRHMPEVPGLIGEDEPAAPVRPQTTHRPGRDPRHPLTARPPVVSVVEVSLDTLAAPVRTRPLAETLNGVLWPEHLATLSPPARRKHRLHTRNAAPEPTLGCTELLAIGPRVKPTATTRPDANLHRRPARFCAMCFCRQYGLQNLALPDFDGGTG